MRFTEEEFTSAAQDSWDSGEEEQAEVLDKLARKINTSLANRSISPLARPNSPLKLGWKDVPS